MNTLQGKTGQAAPKHVRSSTQVLNAQKLNQRAYRTKQRRNGNMPLRMDERSSSRTLTGSRKRCTMQARMPSTQGTSSITTAPPGGLSQLHSATALHILSNLPHAMYTRAQQYVDHCVDDGWHAQSTQQRGYPQPYHEVLERSAQTPRANPDRYRKPRDKR